MFNLQALKKLYSDRIEELGAKNGQLHTRFNERILDAVPDLQAKNKGKEVLLAFTKDIGHALKHACDADYDTDGLLLAKAANIIRRDIFKIKQVFNRQFIENCQQKCSSNTDFTDKHDIEWSKYQRSIRFGGHRFKGIHNNLSVGCFQHSEIWVPICSRYGACSPQQRS